MNGLYLLFAAAHCVLSAQPLADPDLSQKQQSVSSSESLLTTSETQFELSVKKSMAPQKTQSDTAPTTQLSSTTPAEVVSSAESKLKSKTLPAKRDSQTAAAPPTKENLDSAASPPTENSQSAAPPTKENLDSAASPPTENSQTAASPAGESSKSKALSAGEILQPQPSSDDKSLKPVVTPGDAANNDEVVEALSGTVDQSSPYDEEVKYDHFKETFVKFFGNKNSVHSTKAGEGQGQKSWGIEADLYTYENDHNNVSRSTLLNTSLVISYEVNNDLEFNTKLSFGNGGAHQHSGGSNQNGSAVIEYAYASHQLSDTRGADHKVRVGNQLIPIGYSNLNTSGNQRFSVNPPEVESALIPFGWHENGVMFVGQVNYLEYSLGVFNSLDASKFSTSKTTRNFLNDGIQNGQSAKTDDLMGVGRIDYNFLGQNIGASIIYGDTAQDSELDKATLSLWEAHLNLDTNYFQLRALYTEARMSEARFITGPAFFEIARGNYVSLASKWRLSDVKDKSLIFFLRHSNYDLNAKVPTAYERDPFQNKTRTTVGLNFKPSSEIVYKLDYQWRKNASTDEDDLFELGASLAF